MSMCRYMDRQGEEQEGVATMFAATEARNGGWDLFKSNLAQRMFFYQWVIVQQHQSNGLSLKEKEKPISEPLK